VIVKRNLSPRRVLEYTAGPMAWAALWAVAAPLMCFATASRTLARQIIASTRHATESGTMNDNRKHCA
jgi:hypothetical protein